MTKYYVIPLMESGILIPCGRGKNIPINEYVARYFPQLAQLETERVSIINSGDYNAPYTSKQRAQLKNNALQKRQVANELGIPLRILAMSEGRKTYEVGTHSKILSTDQVYLNFREQPRNIFLTFYNGDYIERVKKFMRRKDFIVIQGGAQKVIKR